MNIKRFYRNELPNPTDLVMVKVIREDEEFGYYCQLLEYNNIEAFLPLSELVKTKYAKKHILKPNQVLPMSISKIDGPNVNLTKKRVTNEEAESKKELYRYCSDINKIINECYIMYIKSNKHPLDIESFMDYTIWNMYDTFDADYPRIYQLILHNPNTILPSNIFDSNLSTLIIVDITNRITFTNKIVYMDIKLIVTEDNPISKIKQILTINNPLSSAIVPLNSPNNINPPKITIQTLTSPNYRIKIEGDFQEYKEITTKIKEQILLNAANIKSSITISDPIVEKEATCKIKYYADNILANFSF